MIDFLKLIWVSNELNRGACGEVSSTLCYEMLKLSQPCLCIDVPGETEINGQKRNFIRFNI